jgi:ATP-dependent HslUV protease ATP-binding subunit HslU
VRDEERIRVAVKARESAEERLLDILYPTPPGKTRRAAAVDNSGEVRVGDSDSHSETREKLRDLLHRGYLNDREVEIEITAQAMPMVEVFTPQGMEDLGMNMKELFGQLMPKKTRNRKVKVPEAIEILTQEEAARLVDMESVAREAVQRAEQSGIVFIDEIDKIAGREAMHGPDVSREGVQRDLLPIVEGSSVNTKYGAVRTDHILFVASGAFHTSKPSDLIPEFQGRFPIRVELKALNKDDFIRILTEPENALTKQYIALLATENVQLEFTSDAISALAEIAAQVNARSENIGARRLHTVLERLLEELSFGAPEMAGREQRIDADYVHQRLDPIVKNEDLSRYIL